jgi:hypothetical protein
MTYVTKDIQKIRAQISYKHNRRFQWGAGRAEQDKVSFTYITPSSRRVSNSSCTHVSQGTVRSGYRGGGGAGVFSFGTLKLELGSSALEP